MQTSLAIADTRGMSHEDWLERRRSGIGGSDAASIMGASPYSSPLSVYLDKIGEGVQKQETEAMRQGTAFEPYVAQRFTEATGKRLRRCNRILRHPEYPWMLANIDRDVVGEDAGFEAKTTSVYHKADLEEGEIPPTYFWQCQHYMAVTGASHWYLGVLVLSKAFHVFDIARDAQAIDMLIDMEREFWEEHVLKRIPPLPTGCEADNDALNIIYPQSDSSEDVDLSSEQSTLDLLALYEADKKRMEAKIEALKQTIKARMGENERGFAAGWNVSWKTQMSSRFDAKRFKADHPQLAAQYQKASQSRVFTVKKIMED